MGKALTISFSDGTTKTVELGSTAGAAGSTGSVGPTGPQGSVGPTGPAGGGAGYAGSLYGLPWEFQLNATSSTSAFVVCNTAQDTARAYSSAAFFATGFKGCGLSVVGGCSTDFSKTTNFTSFASLASERQVPTSVKRYGSITGVYSSGVGASFEFRPVPNSDTTNYTTVSGYKFVEMCNSSYGIQLFGTQIGSFTGAHDAVFSKEQTLPEVGDIVVDAELVNIYSVNDAITRVEVANAPNQKNVLGVFAEVSGEDHVPSSLVKFEPTETPEGTLQSVTSVHEDFAHLQETNVFLLINAVGEGAINVCGENGDIEAGDLIVSSSMRGKGMKQADDFVRSCTVAKARNSVKFDSPTQVKQIACTYLCG